MSFWLGAAGLAPAQVPAGGPFSVNSGTAGNQVHARTAIQPNGDFVVVWEGTDIIGPGIFAQRFSASGAPRGGEIAVNSYSYGRQARPAAAIGTKGDLVVVWEGDRAFDGAASGIQGHRFDAAGAPVGADFAITSSSSAYAHDPAVGRAAGGPFVVAWMSPWRPNDPGGVRARRFDASGAALGGDIAVYPGGAHSNEQNAAIAVQPSGTFVVAWDGWDYYGSSSVYGRHFDAAGTPTTWINVVSTSTDGRRTSASVDATPDGRAIIAWTSEFGDGSGSSITARRIEAGGNPTAGEFIVNTYTTGSQSGEGGQVAVDHRGNFVITWGGDAGLGGIRGQRFDADGIPRGAEFEVSAPNGSPQFSPSVASDEVGNFVVTWEAFGVDGSGTAVVAQRFGGLGAAALAIDTGGNGVLEAGETVDARPEWRNYSGAAQTIAGALTRMTGPAGATYSIVDGVGDYGLIADGATAGCTDCYSVSVSNPSLRPAMHWDASVDEGLIPDAQGQQKRWLLHVGGTFSDVPAASPYYAPIETLVHHGITAGCALFTPDTFCPGAAVTREQIAPLLLMAKEGAEYPRPACTGTVFKDVKVGSPFCGFIEELARRGVVTGCAPTLYCPSQVVAREEIAVLLLRTLDPALNPPPCGTTTFYNDVPASHPFCRWIEELARRGVVSDCGGGNYCPSAEVTREQAAFFVTGAFDLTLYGS
jgi:hypothetical protein